MGKSRMTPFSREDSQPYILAYLAEEAEIGLADSEVP